MVVIASAILCKHVAENINEGYSCMECIHSFEGIGRVHHFEMAVTYKTNEEAFQETYHFVNNKGAILQAFTTYHRPQADFYTSISEFEICFENKGIHYAEIFIDEKSKIKIPFEVKAQNTKMEESQ